MAKLAGALILTAAVTVGSVFSGPDEICGGLSEEILNPTPIVLDIDSVDAPDDSGDQAPEESKKSGIRARLKAAILSLPPWARYLMVTPLWALGYLFLWLGGLLASRVLVPYAGPIIAALVGFAVMAGLFAAAAKSIFPEIPFKKIFSKRNLLALGAIALLFAAGDALGPLYYEDWPIVSAAVKLAAGLLLVNIMLARMSKKVKENG